MKKILKKIINLPVVKPAIEKFIFPIINSRFKGSKEYWKKRYVKGGNSGQGSYGKEAKFKAKFINDFVKKNKVKKVIEFGCGDGNQLSMMKYPAYTGLDVSQKAIEICSKKFKKDKHKSFFQYDPTGFVDNGKVFNADLSLSLDVIYHLVEDEMFETHMRHLFSSSEKWVIIYSTDTEDQNLHLSHVRHRKFTNWVKKNLKNWKLAGMDSGLTKVESKSNIELNAGFYIFKKVR